MTMQLIYLHGFQSSPQSQKAQQLLKACLARHIPLQIPDLNAPPTQVVAQLDALIGSATMPVGLVGSSLGGFYAHIMAVRHRVPAVLINPAIAPWRLFQDLFDVARLPYRVSANWQLDAAQLTDLAQLALPQYAAPQHAQAASLLVLLQSADEVLDYSEAERYYRRCCRRSNSQGYHQAGRALVLTEQGGDHAMHNFEQKIPLLLHFLSTALTPTNAQLQMHK